MARDDIGDVANDLGALERHPAGQAIDDAPSLTCCGYHIGYPSPTHRLRVRPGTRWRDEGLPQTSWLLPTKPSTSGRRRRPLPAGGGRGRAEREHGAAVRLVGRRQMRAACLAVRNAGLGASLPRGSRGKKVAHRKAIGACARRRSTRALAHGRRRRPDGKPHPINGTVSVGRRAGGRQIHCLRARARIGGVMNAWPCTADIPWAAPSCIHRLHAGLGRGGHLRGPRLFVWTHDSIAWARTARPPSHDHIARARHADCGHPPVRRNEPPPRSAGHEPTADRALPSGQDLRSRSPARVVADGAYILRRRRHRPDLSLSGPVVECGWVDASSFCGVWVGRSSHAGGSCSGAGR